MHVKDQISTYPNICRQSNIFRAVVIYSDKYTSSKNRRGNEVLEVLVKRGTQITRRRQSKQRTQHRKLKRQYGPHRNPEVNPCAREMQAIPASHKINSFL